MVLAAVKWALSNTSILKHLFPIQRIFADGAIYWACHKSTYSSLPDDYNCKVELALTSDGRTIVCYHPSVDIPYEHTKPIPRPDPVHNHEETQDQVLKTRLEEKGEHFEQGPMIEQLSKMFFTTKHRWYPRGEISLRFSSGDLSFPCSHSMRSQGHSNSYIKNGAMTQAQGNLHIFPEVVESWKYFYLIK
ncbi:39S ribosomal protein L42, mitochondrial isoform X1 [Rhinolophus ferrumequinum]|uniref:39S ribosomal protein L42, mitochondrial isoform X1 n=1 Tax=Rhinolophus ferrumequinum TaxID=59479 RepID=UPI00140F549D|nr:39S ribosomal protein L42, mitochondrial isoform X1 [Rhinolophus ferrumequinum]